MLTINKITKEFVCFPNAFLVRNKKNTNTQKVITTSKGAAVKEEITGKTIIYYLRVL